MAASVLLASCIITIDATCFINTDSGTATSGGLLYLTFGSPVFVDQNNGSLITPLSARPLSDGTSLFGTTTGGNGNGGWWAWAGANHTTIYKGTKQRFVFTPVLCTLINLFAAAQNIVTPSTGIPFTVEFFDTVGGPVGKTSFDGITNTQGVYLVPYVAPIVATTPMQRVPIIVCNHNRQLPSFGKVSSSI